MTRAAFNRDNVLTPAERAASARKCIELLSPELDAMAEREYQFVGEMSDKIDRWGVSERQLAWLRDLVEKYAQ